ncbi:MAG: M13 family metallopeptidase [Prevotella sp.]|jgi:putative endopeptidase|nr:M13 family metallopeptidase [Prevotella sp.]
MKKSYYLFMASLMLYAAGCKKGDIVYSDKGLDIANLDTTAVPGADFFRYATGGWSDANPIPDEYSRYGTFDKLRENNQEQVKGLIEELGQTQHENGSVAQKIGDLYVLGMDSLKLNADGAAPIREQLDSIAAAASVDDIIRLSGELRHYTSASFLVFFVGADDKNSSKNIAHIAQGGLGLGERDYYLSNEPKSKQIREQYTELIVKQFANAGYSEPEAIKAAATVLKIETALAKSHFEKEKTREAELNYHKLNVSQLNDSVAKFPWDDFFNAIGANGMKELDVAQIEPVAAAVKLMQTTSVAESKIYLSWCLINSAARYLSDDFVNANFEFYGKQLSGRKINQPRWKRTVNAINEALGEEVGRLYVEKYFPPQAKERMLKLVDNLRWSLSERISGLDWMSNTTKQKAHEKLGSFTVKIGYPDKWRDCSKLKIEKEDSYWENMARASKFDFDFMLSKLGKDVDKTEWFMSPQTVNAYYNPTTNEITFPAGILQPPFFYMNADDAVNYGAIGVVIGHEMTHGFDDQGRKYDKDGNMFDWWTEEDAKKFKERSQMLVEHFNNIVVLDSVHANGQFTLGENLADYGGLQVAYNAFAKTAQFSGKTPIDGFTPQQRFFLSYATLWAGNIRDEEILRLTQIDVHSLGKWRVNGALPHINAWYEAFDIQEDAPLFIPKDKRVSIW